MDTGLTITGLIVTDTRHTTIGLIAILIIGYTEISAGEAVATGAVIPITEEADRTSAVDEEYAGFPEAHGKAREEDFVVA